MKEDPEVASSSAAAAQNVDNEASHVSNASRVNESAAAAGEEEKKDDEDEDEGTMNVDNID